MRAIVQRTLGGPEVLELTDVSPVEAAPTEILVRVLAAGVNPIDWKSRRTGGLLGRPPFTVGWDVSGVVEAVGPGVTRFAPGDEVYGMPRFPHAAGAYAEYVTGPARHFAGKPSGVDFIGAAALPLAGLTAWQALMDTARVTAGQRVLVHAAAGGVGHLAVQVAKAHGAYVVGTASAAKHEFVRALGADAVIDYTAQDFTTVVRDFDAVLDPIGGEHAERSLATLKRGGILVCIAGLSTAAALHATAAAQGRRAATMLVEPDHAALAELARLVDKGELRPHVTATFPLTEAARAHELGESNHTTGKLVLTVALETDGS